MIVRIYTSAETGAPMVSYRSRQLIAGKGLEGDRYALGTGFYSGCPEWDAHVTLAPIEPVEALNQHAATALDLSTLRRNFLTRGVDLTSLIGVEFQLGGTAILRGRKAWPPCSHLVKSSGQTAIFKHLARHCGIGADVLVGGTISLGDSLLIHH